MKNILRGRIFGKPKRDSYAYLKRKFVENGDFPGWDRRVRKSVIKRFEIIDRNIKTATTSSDGLFLAEFVFSMKADGDIVECGTYAGASAAKLSILAEITGRKLYIFDSFEGLPETGKEDITDFHARRNSQWVTPWEKGRYRGDIGEVKSNIEKYGSIEACVFKKGFFSKTLNSINLPGKIALAFVDVDIASSAKMCIASIWPRLTAGGLYVSHDIAYLKVLDSILDKNLWESVFHEFPPVLFGAGFGLCDASPHMGFFVKGDISGEYIKSLMIDK
ncbi:MAG: class I SAM-dependent methyltransferase [Candidatus Aureabacteria bacterium]|nr:class I SAM-dependent methyltransferase [Candidatus Auribacterota bacterium]